MSSRRLAELGRLAPRPIPLPAERRLSAFDHAVDAWVEAHLRGRAPVDRVMYTASALGDHGVVWILLAALQASRHSHGGRRRLARIIASLAAESALVNGPLKGLFRRRRPSRVTPHPLHLRQPRTSSFPSGHASAAFFGAALLSDGDPWAPLYYAAAVVVAFSRVHVRIHHASDVVGGIVVGAALGAVARRLVPLDGQRLAR
jgi:undecaprenyl-diphosphatase